MLKYSFLPLFMVDFLYFKISKKINFLELENKSLKFKLFEKPQLWYNFL